MPVWEGIEDSSSEASRVWLCRKDETEDWYPLRKCDCEALNFATAQSKEPKPIYIESGRCTADMVAGCVFNNFFRGNRRQLCAAVWFLKEEKSSKEIRLIPISHSQDSEAIEDLYQSAVRATSSLGKGIGHVLQEEVILQEEGANAKVKVYQSGNAVSMRRVPNGWFAGNQELQRGYGPYEVEGEEDETSLGPVRHLVFVVHGIGEALFSREDVKVPSLIDQMNKTRIDIQRRQVKQWKEVCEKAAKEGGAGPPPPSRIEFIPIEWFSRLHDSSSALMASLRATTITSIPALRAIANDVVFDVLMYMTPTFCESVLDCVTAQVNDMHKAFIKINPDFVAADGKVSFIGHSLGSVIVWDLLSILKEKTGESQRSGLVLSDQGNLELEGAVPSGLNLDQTCQRSWGPTLTKPMETTIPFKPATTIFLGSPLGMFLTLRGAHALFDDLRVKIGPSSKEGSCNELPTSDLSSPFTLPSESVYNIFNPSDPVAYRIEPLLLPQGLPVDQLPEPSYLTAPGKDVRLHIRARQLKNDLKKTILDPRSSWSILLDSAVTVLAPETEDSRAIDQTSGGDSRGGGPGHLNFALGGTSERVDFSFQPSIIDHEYLSSVLAHSTTTYFGNEDLQDFLLSIMGDKRSLSETCSQLVTLAK